MSYFNALRAHGRDATEAALEGSLVTASGFCTSEPIPFESAMGSRPSMVIIGGLVSATLLTLSVLLYRGAEA